MNLANWESRKGHCVSMMEAGTAYNNVPHEAFIRMDHRRSRKTSSAVAEVKRLSPMRAVDHPVATVRIERPDWSWPPIITRGLNPL